MADLPTYKRFPLPTGGDTTPRVRVSTPIPLREVPLDGLKTMAFPKASARDILPSLYQRESSAGHEESSIGKALAHIRSALLWTAVVLIVVVLYLYAALLLMSLFWG